MNRFEQEEYDKKRDRFAELAMQSILTDPDNVQDVQNEGFENIAWFCYKVADAMLKERNK